MTTTNTNEIKTEMLTHINRATELHNRNERAKSYSRSVSRKRRERKENFELIVAPIAIILAMGGFFHLTVYLLDLVILGGIM